MFADKALLKTWRNDQHNPKRSGPGASWHCGPTRGTIPGWNAGFIRQSARILRCSRMNPAFGWKCRDRPLHGREQKNYLPLQGQKRLMPVIG
jgi:hypothetical protein